MKPFIAKEAMGEYRGLCKKDGIILKTDLKNS